MKAPVLINELMFFTAEPGVITCHADACELNDLEDESVETGEIECRTTLIELADDIIRCSTNSLGQICKEKELLEWRERFADALKRIDEAVARSVVIEDDSV